MDLPTAFSGKKIVTRKGNLFICLTQVLAGITETFFLYMKPDGTRFISPKEIEWGLSPTSKAWGDAKKNWGNPVVTLTDEELKLAIKLKKEIKKSFIFGFNAEELRQRKGFLREKSQKVINRPGMKK